MPTKDAIWQQALPLLPPGAATACLATSPALGMDSLDFVELVLQVEQHFGTRFSGAELEELRTVQLLLSGPARPGPAVAAAFVRGVFRATAAQRPLVVTARFWFPSPL